ncbi:hypothetical protein P171DRAFT_435003 [Karstenula rhodostoma CBS 690.94]|uniref:Uncharacterized protein n=1 Tax=Karstenula rhodostoma CBS 690.94 TaxID=1392251 RepID=A0A9P4PE78_9PLEO|nr:hypothetical protein P171DRAFT_435003 [Karstenula rhodostoma CBS 690.94]
MRFPNVGLHFTLSSLAVAQNVGLGSLPQCGVSALRLVWGSYSATTPPATTSASESQSVAAQTSTGSPGAAGSVATAGAGLGLAVGVLLAAL